MDWTWLRGVLAGFGLRVLDWLGGLALWLLGFILSGAYWAWDAALGQATLSPAMQTLLTGPRGHSIVNFILFLFAFIVVYGWLASMRTVATRKREAVDKRKTSPLRQGKPFRVPGLDRPKRPMRVSKHVTVALDNENGIAVGMTRSGKSSTAAGLVDGQQATLGLMFDISMPTILAARKLQRKILANKLLVNGVIAHPPVLVWRPRDGTVVLRMLDGLAEEVMDSIRDAFSRSSGDTGHQWGIVFERGTAILNAIDARNEVRTLAGLAGALRKIAANPREDAQTRNACWAWSTKLTSLKAMFGDAEGPTGVSAAEILDQGGTVLMEFNTFASKATAEALAGFAIRILASALNYAHVPVNVLMDESGQMKGRAADIAGIFRACGARGGRVWLCTQDPTDLPSAVSTNIGVWVLFGAGAGAIDVLKWMASITHGWREPGDYIMNRRTVGAVLLGCLGMRRTRIHRECDVIYEGRIQFTTVDAPNLLALKRGLHHADWPNNRGKIEDHGLTEGIPVPPLPPTPSAPVTPTRPRAGSATSKPTNGVAGPQHHVTAPSRGVPTQAGTFVRVEEESFLDARDGPSPWAWINCDPRRVEVWRSCGEPLSEDQCWLVPEKMVTPDGRASFSYGDDERVAGKRSYGEVYSWAGEPNGPVTRDKPYRDHTCHNADASCPGGKCRHLRCINPFTLEPVSRTESARRREAHKKLHAAWRAEHFVVVEDCVEDEVEAGAVA